MGLPELINEYGEEVITNSDLTSTGGLKNKDRVIRKLNIMFEHVEVSGRGRKIQFTLSGLRNEYVLDKRREQITTLQSMLLHNLKSLIANNQLPKEPYTVNQWMEMLGAGKFYSDIQELNKKLHGKGVEKYFLLNWLPNLNNYKEPNFDKIINDVTVSKEINYLIIKWYKLQFESLIPKAKYLGIKFSEIIMGKRSGDKEIHPLSEDEKKALLSFITDNIKYTGANSRMPWEIVEYNRFISGMGYSKVYTMYTCEVSDKMTFVDYKPIPREKLSPVYIQALKKHIVHKEIGKYKGFFNGLTKLPYRLSVERLDHVNDLWALRSIEKKDLDSLIIKRLQTDYELLLGISTDTIIDKLIRSRMLYKVFKEIIKMFCDIELDDTYYNNAVKNWENAYEKEVENGIEPFSVMEVLKG